MRLCTSLISGLQSIFDEAHERLDEKLNEILTTLRGLKKELAAGIIDILEAIDGIRRQIDEDVALDNMTLSDLALFTDLAIFNDKQKAMGDSFQAADRLLSENDVAFVSPFIYVINIRLSVLTDFDPNYFRIERFQQEFRTYIAHLKHLISQINNSIEQSHTIEVILTDIVLPAFKPPRITRFWVARYHHKGVTVATFAGPSNDISQTARNGVEQQARAARAAAVKADRQQFGVVEMEQTAAAWERAFLRN